jgi:hypothetical protein
MTRTPERIKSPFVKLTVSDVNEAHFQMRSVHTLHVMVVHQTRDFYEDVS